MPVIDLNARFGKKSIAVGRRNCIIIEAEDGESRQSVGVMVDAVNEVMEIPDSDIEPAPVFGTRICTDFIAGMAKVNGNFAIVLNIQHVLSMDDMEAIVSMEISRMPSSVELAPSG